MSVYFHQKITLEPILGHFVGFYNKSTKKSPFFFLLKKNPTIEYNLNPPFTFPETFLTLSNLYLSSNYWKIIFLVYVIPCFCLGTFVLCFMWLYHLWAWGVSDPGPGRPSRPQYSGIGLAGNSFEISEHVEKMEKFLNGDMRVTDDMRVSFNAKQS